MFAFIIDDEVIVMKRIRIAFHAISIRSRRFLSPVVLSSFILAALMSLTALSAPVLAQADFHIGLMTGTISAAEDSLQNTKNLINRYGSVKNRGMILHVTYPDQFISEMETTIGQIVRL